MSIFKRLFTLFSLLSVLVLAVGISACPHRDKDKPKKPKEEAWMTHFKSEMARTEERFFSSRYIQNKDDAFYLKEILPRIQGHLASGKSIGSLPTYLKEQIALRRDDFTQSWPVLSTQLERMSVIFGLVAVVPSYHANLETLVKVNQMVDVESAAMLAQFKLLIDKNTIFTPAGMQLAPKVQPLTNELANKIAARTLGLLATALANPQLPANLKAEVTSHLMNIRVLNHTAAATAGMPFDPAKEPFMEDPHKIWPELKTIYDKLFSILTDADQIDNLLAEADKLPVGKKKSNLLSNINVLIESLKPRFDEVPGLQEREAKLMTSLLTVTDAQFKLARSLTADE